MTIFGQRVLRCFGTLFLVGMLVVPPAFRGHQHERGLQSNPDTCPVCVATSHARAITPAAPPQLLSAVDSVAVVALPSAEPAQVYRPFATGRSPPLLFAARVP